MVLEAEHSTDMKDHFYCTSRHGLLSPPSAVGTGSSVFEAGKLRQGKQPQSQIH